MNTAPVERPVVSKEVAPGVKVDTSMSPAQRFEIIKANIANVPTQFHTDANVTRFANEERDTTRAAAKAPPPSQAGAKAPPPSVPPQGTPAERARDPAGFTPPAAPTAEVATVDAGFISALNAAYRALSPADRTAKHSQYLAELAEGYSGRRLGEARGNFLARTAGQPGSDKPVVQAHVPGHEPKPVASEAATNAALDKATKASNQYGWAPAHAITGPLLHGYTIPAGREYNVAELVAGLRLARGGNLSQEQVNAIIARSNA